MLDMEVIVRRQDQEHCASDHLQIRHYVARRLQVTEGHPHNAAERADAPAQVLCHGGHIASTRLGRMRRRRLVNVGRRVEFPVLVVPITTWCERIRA